MYGNGAKLHGHVERSTGEPRGRVHAYGKMTMRHRWVSRYNPRSARVRARAALLGAVVPNPPLHVEAHE